MREDVAINELGNHDRPLLERLRLLKATSPARAIMHEAADRIAELEAALADILNTAVPVLTGGHQSRALSEIWQIVHKALGKDPVNG